MENKGKSSSITFKYFLINIIFFTLVWVLANGAFLTTLCYAFFNGGKEEASQVKEAKGDSLHSRKTERELRARHSPGIYPKGLPSGLHLLCNHGREWQRERTEAQEKRGCELGKSRMGLGENEDGDLGRMRMRTWREWSLYS